jgi:hypothetical protein
MFALAGLVGALVATPIAVYASHQFTDVPDSAFYSNSVTWMKDNGITVGCNPPANTKYCPNDNVTRGEMAVLMKRLSEKKVVDAATAVNADNADTLEGFTAAELAPRTAFNSTDSAGGGDFTLSTPITAPAAGILLLSATIDADNFTASDFYTCSLKIDGGLVSGTNMAAELNGSAVVNRSENCTTTGAAVVAAGTYTIDFDVTAVAPSTFLTAASVWVLWVPLDGTGAIPTP